MPTAVVTHKYEFPSENPIATFGAGWTLAGSVTRPLFFKVGDSLDDIITQFNGWQDVGTETPLTKTVVLHQIEYTRKAGADVVTITYPTISNRVDTAIAVSGTITTADRSAFTSAVPGTEIAGWMVTNKVHHAVVTLVATTSRKINTSTNPRFLSGLEAIDYVRTPAPLPLVQLQLQPCAAPSSPGAVTATKISDTSVSVSFTPSTYDSGEVPPTHYTVRLAGGRVVASGSASPIVVTNLTEINVYSFNVVATNMLCTSGVSAPSATSNVVACGTMYTTVTATIINNSAVAIAANTAIPITVGLPIYDLAKAMGFKYGRNPDGTVLLQQIVQEANPDNWLFSSYDGSQSTSVAAACETYVGHWVVGDIINYVVGSSTAGPNEPQYATCNVNTGWGYERNILIPKGNYPIPEIVELASLAELSTAATQNTQSLLPLILTTISYST